MLKKIMIGSFIVSVQILNGMEGAALPRYSVKFATTSDAEQFGLSSTTLAIERLQDCDWKLKELFCKAGWFFADYVKLPPQAVSDSSAWRNSGGQVDIWLNDLDRKNFKEMRLSDIKIIKKFLNSSSPALLGIWKRNEYVSLLVCTIAVDDELERSMQTYGFADVHYSLTPFGKLVKWGGIGGGFAILCLGAYGLYKWKK